MNLYLVSHETEDDEYDMDLIVRASGPLEAYRVWRDYVLDEFEGVYAAFDLPCDDESFFRDACIFPAYEAVRVFEVDTASATDPGATGPLPWTFDADSFHRSGRVLAVGYVKL